jgi:hypothetical protein
MAILTDAPAKYNIGEPSQKGQSTVTAAPLLIPKPTGTNALFSQPNAVYGDWRDDILRDGYAVVKGAVPRERAIKYGEEMFSYLENL